MSSLRKPTKPAMKKPANVSPFDMTGISSIRNDSMSSFSSTRTRSVNSTTLDIDFKKNSSDDLIKKIEHLVTSNHSLEEENTVLRNLINEESKNFGIDERRLLMLKCQIYQLEKQINILSKSVSFRKHAHTDSFNALCFLSDSFRLIMNKNGTLSNSFVIEKSDLEKWIEMTESSKLKLIRAQHDEDADPASDKLLFESNYSNKEINILDICTGNLNHVNLKQVAVLESNLAQLYKKLTRLGESFKTVKNLSKNEAQSNSSPLPFHNQSLRSQIDESAKVTLECCQKLFDLSMLVPSAPWSAIKKSPVEQLSQESLMEKLKSISLPKSKQISVEILLKSLFVSSNYHYHMKSVECAALNEELDFYRSCYSLQKNYVESVTELFRAKYEQFVKELSETVRDPLRILIDKFWLMKESSTEENLKEFLGIFKNYVSTFNKVISNFDSIPNSETITRTFNQLLVQLDTEVLKLNERCLSKKESFNLESIDLKKLSLESDEILIDYIKPSPKSSPEK